MRKLFAVLALAALAAACGDQPMEPAAPEVAGNPPGYALVDGGPGAWVGRWPKESGWCLIWDGDGNLGVPADCQMQFTPGPNGNFGFLMKATGIANTTGRNLHFDPTFYPQSLPDVYVWWLGYDVRVDGQMPLCDWNQRLYQPDEYGAWPWEGLTCTLNWHYTLSKSGIEVLTASFAGENSWHPFPNGR